MSQIRFSDERYAVNVGAQTAHFDAAFPKTATALTQVTQGMGDAGDGAFASGPKGLVQYVLGATDKMGETTKWSNVFNHYALNWRDNPVSRVAWAGITVVGGLADLVTLHGVHYLADKSGIADYMPFLSAQPTDVRGWTRDIMSIAMLRALPEGVKISKMMARSAARAVPALDAALSRAQAIVALQQAADATLQRILVADDAAFARAWKATAPAGQMGALDLSWMLGANKSTFVDLFRRNTITNAELEVLSQHADSNVAGAARQVLAERTTPLPEGYMPIPGGEFEGQTLSPFAMKATPVTNAEWLQGVDGKPRYVLLAENPNTLVISVVDATTRPPSFIMPITNFDAGHIAKHGGQILVKLVDTPSAAFDVQGRVFSRVNQPVVGITYYHAQAWVLSDASGRLMLPTDVLQWAVASNFGKQPFGTATGRLFVGNGRKLGHFDESYGGRGTTADVNDPRYLPGPFKVHSMYNVWRWMQADPSQRWPNGLRGASWNNHGKSGSLNAAFRNISEPGRRRYDVGFQPVVLPGLLK